MAAGWCGRPCLRETDCLCHVWAPLPPTLAQLSPTASPPCWPWLPSARAPQPLNHRRTVTVTRGPSMWPNRAQRITHQAVVVTILRGRYGYCPHCTAEQTKALAGGETGWRPWAASGGARCPRLIRLQSSVPGPSVHPFPHLPDKPGLLITWVTTSSNRGPRTCVLPSEQGTRLPPPHNSPRREAQGLVTVLPSSFFNAFALLASVFSSVRPSPAS